MSGIFLPVIQLDEGMEQLPRTSKTRGNPDSESKNQINHGNDNKPGIKNK
jgi:hypothetical protein